MNEVINGMMTITLSGVVVWMLRVLMVLLLLAALVSVRQVSLMSRVVNVPINGWFKMIAWGYLLTVVIATAIVMLV